VGNYYEVTDHFDIETIRSLVLEAGFWGWVVYIGAFSAGEFVHIPGLVFVAAGILAWGKIVGFFLAYLGAVVSVCFSFVIVRRIGGTAFDTVKNARIQKALAHLADHPVRTVFVLRSMLWMAPPLNYALALTSLRLSHYLIGSALGLILPIALSAYFIDWVVTLF